MLLTVRHTTTHHYATPAHRVALLLRLKPGVFDGQRLLWWSVDVNGLPVEDFIPNAHGDMEAYAQAPLPGNELVITATGLVETTDRHGVVRGVLSRMPPPVYLRDTGLTVANEAIRTLGTKAATAGPGALEQMHALSAIVREAVSYRAGVTESQSTAAQALALGHGVCQDHAHVFVSAARSIGIPARYVAGYFMADKAEDALHETHGWAEAHVDGLGWIGFDITNGKCATDHYVRLCAGLDAHDAAPIRGSLFGADEIGIDADVLIGEAGEEELQQMQQQQQ